MDIPFIRFALPLVILYFYWNVLIANPWVEEAADSNPNAISIAKSQQLLDKSKKLVQAGQLREALAPSLQLYQAFPENDIYIQQLAQIYDELGQYEDSARMWEHYMQYAPTPIDGCPMLGFAYEKLGRMGDAYKAHERCWQFSQNNGDMIFFYAHSLERQGEFARAIKLYEQGLKRFPNYPDLQIGLARSEMQLGQFAASRKALDHVLATPPDNSDALVASGLLHLRMGQSAAALRDLELAHRVSPKYKEAELLLTQLRGSRAKRGE